MSDPLDKLHNLWSQMEEQITRLRGTPAVGGDLISRWRSDTKALLFHLQKPRHDHPALTVLLGGTGTGKSTLTNRLLEANISAASFRRTFTSGPVAIARDNDAIPQHWLRLDHQIIANDSLPARGQAGALAIVLHKTDLTNSITLTDTPDLDGDQPAHHAEADRAFRWAQAIIFLVTPEKYQMTELLPYYRLAQRYALPTLFVMNKLEESAVLEDFRQQLVTRGLDDPRIFALPRDDAAYEPPPDANLQSLRKAVGGLNHELAHHNKNQRCAALANRSSDLLDRLRDQIISPLRDQRRAVDSAIASLRAMAVPAAGIDVSPVTRQLQRRMQEQSILYLMGPQRMLDRVRQVPGLLLRLPRTAFDLLRGQSVSLFPPTTSQSPGQLPDFSSTLTDQFTILQSRVDDVISATPHTAALISADGQLFSQAKIPATEAAKIAQEELDDLKKWLQERWDAPPRDTRILHKLLSVLPGGKKISQWSEAAPYLLAVVVAAHHAFFGPIDLLILGSFTLATWVGEKLSNEVTARSRATNARISQRFTRLAEEQVERICQWLDQQVPSSAQLMKLERHANALAELSSEAAHAQ
ncbi:MAG TPA: GTPase domain-containing protein [Tepidisphaeraceae bacterium]|jgi:hypothetical protein|nr:GTPase domain-containing protein [Tepidisphaeraceae bacterium]